MKTVVNRGGAITITHQHPSLSPTFTINNNKHHNRTHPNPKSKPTSYRPSTPTFDNYLPRFNHGHPRRHYVVAPTPSIGGISPDAAIGAFATIAASSSSAATTRFLAASGAAAAAAAAAATTTISRVWD